MTLAQWIVVAVAAQRLIELMHARRNEARLRAAGAVEAGAGHYPLIILLHAAWLLTLFLVAPADDAISWALLTVYAALQIGRLWVIATLGRFWTTRVLTLPGAPLMTGGPYRLCRHPNYVIVVAEIAVLPLAFGAWQVAVLFSLANGLLLWWRIRVEDEALRGRRTIGDASAPSPGQS